MLCKTDKNARNDIISYGGPKGPTQTKKENANKKEHIAKQKKKTHAKKHNASKKVQNANKNTKRKQKTQLKLHQSHVNYVHFNGFVLRFYSFLALYRKR